MIHLCFYLLRSFCILIVIDRFQPGIFICLWIGFNSKMRKPTKHFRLFITCKKYADLFRFFFQIWYFTTEGTEFHRVFRQKNITLSLTSLKQAKRVTSIVNRFSFKPYKQYLQQKICTFAKLFLDLLFYSMQWAKQKVFYMQQCPPLLLDWHPSSLSCFSQQDFPHLKYWATVGESLLLH